MKMKNDLPMMLIAALPLGADAQNNRARPRVISTRQWKPADSFYQFATGGWQKNNPSLPLTAVMAVLDQPIENKQAHQHHSF